MKAFEEQDDKSSCNNFNRPPNLKQLCWELQASWAYIRAFRSPLDRRNGASLAAFLLFESFVFFVTILRLSPSLTCKFVPFTPSRIGNTMVQQLFRDDSSSDESDNGSVPKYITDDDGMEWTDDEDNQAASKPRPNYFSSVRCIVCYEYLDYKCFISHYIARVCPYPYGYG